MAKCNNSKTIPSLFRVFCPLILFIGGVLVFTSLSDFEKTFGTNNKDVNLKNGAKEVDSSRMANFWQKSEPLTTPIPDSVLEKAKKVQINIKRINITNVNTFYREALPPLDMKPSEQTVLLLHGARFKSQTWLDLNTINLLAGMGHHVVAVDLPGYGETSSRLSGKPESYLKDLIGTLQLKNLVIVSPSMSGGFSIPYLINHSQELDGYVPVAPVSTERIVGETSKITTPTLIIYGERDVGLGITSLKNLTPLPNSKSVMLEKATHPAYLDDPNTFHTLLYNFLAEIKRRQQST